MAADVVVCTVCGSLVEDWWRHRAWHLETDTWRFPSDTPQCPPKRSNPSDTHDAPSVGNLESVSPQSEQVAPNMHPAPAAVLRVLAPKGVPIFEWAHETTPTDEEMGTLAHEIVAELMLAGYCHDR